LRITAAVPCYNAARQIGACLESLLNQSLPPDEVIVVDDGSTDKSAEVVGQFNQVRLVRLEENRGVACARNVAVGRALGDVVVFIDADAVADRDLIKELVACYDGEVAGVGGRAIEAPRRSIADDWRSLHAAQTHGERFKRDVDFLWGVCCSYRRSALVLAGGFDERFRTNGEDMELGFRLRQEGQILSYTPEAVVYHKKSDSLKTLCKMMYRWYLFGYAAWEKNRGRAFDFYVKTCIKVLLRNLATDIIRRRSPALACISLAAFLFELKATLDGARACRTILGPSMFGSESAGP